jgi:hypothetical protein
MKKILFALSIGFVSIAAFSNCVYAVNSEKNAGPSVHSTDASRGSAVVGNGALNTSYINIRAIRDFQTKYNKAENAMWFSGPNNGFISYFVQDGYGNRVVYDKHGRWQFSLITYGEDKLPRDIRATIKFTYVDMHIALAEEVQTAEGIQYVIYLEDKFRVRVVKVNPEHEMEVLQDLGK